MAYTPYQPYGGYNYQQTYIPYVPPRFDGLQQPQNAAGAPSSVPAMSAPSSQQTGFLCRPVTSREEALAVQADYFSPGTLMPDLGHNVVYLKRFNTNTGASDMFKFALVQDAPSEQAVPAETVSPKILETINTQLEDLIERMDALSVKMDQPKSKQTTKKGSGEE